MVNDIRAVMFLVVFHFFSFIAVAVPLPLFSSLRGDVYDPIRAHKWSLQPLLASALIDLVRWRGCDGWLCVVPAVSRLSSLGGKRLESDWNCVSEAEGRQKGWSVCSSLLGTSADSKYVRYSNKRCHICFCFSRGTVYHLCFDWNEASPRAPAVSVIWLDFHCCVLLSSMQKLPKLWHLSQKNDED